MSSDEIKSIVLAAGKGTRMKSDSAKVLHKIFDKALLGYVLDILEGITNENFVIVGHKANEVGEYIKKYSSTSALLQEPQLGTGDAVFKAYDSLKDYKGDVIVLCGDTPLLTKPSIEKMINCHKENGAALTVMSAILENPANYGRIVRDEKDNLAAIVEEKDATDAIKAIKEINAGVYCLNWPQVCEGFKSFKTDNAQGEYYLTDIVKWAKDKGLKLQSFVVEDNQEILGINSREQLAQAFNVIKMRKLSELMNEGVTIVDPSTTYISPQTLIDKDTTVFPCTYIEGENKIGQRCKVGPFARIRGGCEVGNEVKIGNFVEIKNAIIKNNTNVSHLSYMGDCEIGANVNIGAGTISANYNSITKVKSKTIIEDRASIGSNTVLVAPLKIGKNSFIAALSVVTKDIADNALALTRAPLKIVKNWVKFKN